MHAQDLCLVCFAWSFKDCTVSHTNRQCRHVLGVAESFCVSCGDVSCEVSMVDTVDGVATRDPRTPGFKASGRDWKAVKVIMFRLKCVFLTLNVSKV